MTANHAARTRPARSRLPPSPRRRRGRGGDPLRRRDQALRLHGGGRGSQSPDSARRVLLAAGAVRVWEDHHAADGRRFRTADRGQRVPRGRARRGRPSVPAQRQHGVPVLCPVRAPGRGGERRLRAKAAQGRTPTRSAHGSRRRSSSFSSPAASTPSRASCRAVRCSASRLPARWSTAPRCCCSTSRSARST